MDKLWYPRSQVWHYVLWPLALPYAFVAVLRRWFYKLGIFKVHKLGLPVIVVGNLSVGGNGKTPLVVALCKYLRRHGYKPGIVSRGYGGKTRRWPQLVTKDSDPVQVGDEPVLLAMQTGCPLVVAPNRVKAARMLSANHDVNIIISDDGLQHYALARNIEIVVINGRRKLGNGLCLPVGPLREPLARLKSVSMQVVSDGVCDAGQLALKSRLGLVYRQGAIDRKLAPHSGPVAAVTGIADPTRFFNSLRKLGFKFTENVFPDHHPFDRQDLQSLTDLPIVMTEKDAVKCQAMTDLPLWSLPLEFELDSAFCAELDAQLSKLDCNNSPHS